ncbi:MAG: CotH kinase family protein, partial [Clostridiales bacterium]|nr:CotH kinase family protein [Clostridiales bacterium]
MKNFTKKLFMTFAAAVIMSVLLALTAFAAETDIYDSLSFQANASDTNTVIYTQTIDDGSRYLFLPSSASLTELTLYYENAEEVTFSTSVGSVAVVSGEAFDLTALFDGTADEYTVTVTADGEASELTIMKSSNLRAMYLVSDDPVNKGREYVDAVKGNKGSGLISLLSVDGKVDYSNTLTEIKGRGNSTFTDFDKKPYQIKIGKKADLINDDSSEKSKKWVLLANAAETTLLHNAITFDLANALGMAYVPHYEFIDLYYDGEYRGNYLLTEKTEIDDGRIEIQDTDGLIEDLNAGTDAYENPTVVTKTTASGGEKNAAENSAGSYRYVEGLVEPELTEGTTHHAYLLEIEFNNRYPDELTGFVTERGQTIVTGNPEYLTKETGAYISSLWQEFEDAVYSEDGYNKETGKYYYEYCDLDSLVNLYLVNEIAKNFDGYLSSTYFYLPEDSDIFYAGPVWDYDNAYGTSQGMLTNVYSNPENFLTLERVLGSTTRTRYLIGGLREIESFRDAVQAALDSETGVAYNAVQELLGEDGTIRQLEALIYDSQKMNYVLWPNLLTSSGTVVASGQELTYDNAVDYL